MNIYKRKALEFYKEFKISQLTVDSITCAIQKCGYKIIEYVPFSTDNKAYALLSELGIIHIANTEKSFVYADNLYRILFIAKGLSEKEKLMLLSHEAGHIYLNHMSRKNLISGEDIAIENEAREFSHYLLTCNRSFSLISKISQHKGVVIGGVLSFLFLVIFLSVLIPQIYTSNIRYVSPMGEKYHRYECVTIKNKDSLTKNNKKKLESLGYTPCDLCLP